MVCDKMYKNTTENIVAINGRTRKKLEQQPDIFLKYWRRS